MPSNMLSQLFRRYAANFRMYFGGAGDLVACPLCYEVVDWGAVEAGRVSLEHVPPQSVGGRITTITCTECNNTQGSRLDSHLVKRLVSEDTHVRPVRVSVPNSPISIGGHLHVVEGEPPSIALVGRPAISHPDVAKEIWEALQNKIPITVTPQYLYNERKARLAQLRVGYLMLFQWFGYDYLRFGIADIVRRQLTDPAELLVDHAVLNLDHSDLAAGGLYAIHTPRHLRCFLAVFETTIQRTRRFGVILPGLDAEAGDVYDRWSSRETGSITGWAVPTIDIADEGTVGSAISVWAAVVANADMGSASGRRTGSVQQRLLFAPSAP